MSGDPLKQLPFDANNSTLLDMVMGPMLTSLRPIPGVNKLQMLGPVLLPLPANCILVSLLTVQIVRYWTSPVQKHDAWPTKTLVWCAMVFGIANMLLSWKWSVDAFVLNFGRPHALFRSSHMAPLLALLQIEIFFMHCWYAYKTYHLYGRSFLPPTLILVLSGAMSVTAIMGTIVLAQQRSVLASGTSSWAHATAQVGVWTGAAADISITSLISIKLIRSRSGWKDTDLLAARVGLLVLESQSVPTILGLVNAIYTQKMKRPEFAIVWCFIGGNLYALSVLYSLTSRTWFRRGNYRDGSDRYYGREVEVRVATEVTVNRSNVDPNPPKQRHAGLRPTFSEEHLDDVGKKVDFVID